MSDKTRVTISLRWLKFDGMPVVNSKLKFYSRKLDYAAREELAIRMVRGDRFAVFNLDGERVSLAEGEPVGMVVA